jgi:hypothetical protein
VMRDANGRARVLTEDEARRIASNIAKLPEEPLIPRNSRRYDSRPSSLSRRMWTVIEHSPEIK